MKMSQQSSSPFTRFSDMSTSTNAQSLSVLASASPNVSKPQIQISPSVPISSTPMASATMTGLISPDAQIISTSSPLHVHQTINSPIVPITTVGRETQGVLSQPRLSPGVNTFATVNRQNSPRSSIYSISSPNSVNEITILPPNSPSISRLPSMSPSISRLQSTGSLMTAMSPLPPVINNNYNYNTNLESVVSQQNLSLPMVEMENSFEITNYQGIIRNGNIENELLEAGYGILSRIIVKDPNGNKRAQYIKSINKNGQKVFVLIDGQGYTKARSADLTLVESNRVNIVPYSLKTGAYECAGKDVCGVAFECGSDGVCVLSRGVNDLTPKEANFVLVEKPTTTAAAVEIDGKVMTYPVVRLSEIRVNPSLVLDNTDLVTRNLRNTSYQMELAAFNKEMQSLAALNDSFRRYNIMRENVHARLTYITRELEKWNKVYKENPPTTDDMKNRYRLLQINLTRRNEDMETFLLVMKKISNKAIDLDLLTEEVNSITEYASKHFNNVEYITPE